MSTDLPSAKVAPAAQAPWRGVARVSDWYSVVLIEWGGVSDWLHSRPYETPRRDASYRGLYCFGYILLNRGIHGLCVLSDCDGSFSFSFSDVMGLSAFLSLIVMGLSAFLSLI